MSILYFLMYLLEFFIKVAIFFNTILQDVLFQGRN